MKSRKEYSFCSTDTEKFWKDLENYLDKLPIISIYKYNLNILFYYSVNNSKNSFIVNCYIMFGNFYSLDEVPQEKAYF